MDVPKKDELRERRRDEAIVRRMGEALDQLSPREVAECPDAEIIAAYHEQALGTGESARWEDHFAKCSRCRKILAVLAASDEAPLAENEVARLGELVASASAPRNVAPQIIKPSRPSGWDWRVRWLAPALVGIAAVLALWFAVRPPWRAMDQGSSGTLIAQAPENETPPSVEPRALDQLSNAAPTKKPETDSAVPSAAQRDQSVSKTQSDNPAAAALPENHLEKSIAEERRASGAAAADSTSEDEKKQKADGAAGTVGELASRPAVPVAPPPPPPPPNLQAEVQTMSQPAQPAPRAATNAPASGLVAPSARAAVQGKIGAANQDAASFGAASSATGMGILKSPSDAVSWRIGPNGRIERSTDGGRSWISQGSPSQQDWLAGVAVSDMVCWIVGRNGAIARTTDGEQWQQIVPPSNAATSGKLPDWTAVTASDGQTATVTAGDHRRYATQDGGKTWRAQ